MCAARRPRPPTGRRCGWTAASSGPSCELPEIPGSPSPPRSPEAPVHDRALLGLRRLEPLVGDLLLKGETLVFRVRLLVTDVQAVTAVRVGIAVDDVAVLRLRDQLQGRHRMELLRSLRRVGWLRREPG